MAIPEPSSLRLAFNADADQRQSTPEQDANASSESMRAAFDAIRQAILGYEQNLADAPAQEARPLAPPDAARADTGTDLEATEGRLLRETEARVRAEIHAEQVVSARAAAEASARAAAQARADAEARARALTESLARAEHAAAQEAEERAQANSRAVEALRVRQALDAATRAVHEERTRLEQELGRRYPVRRRRVSAREGIPCCGLHLLHNGPIPRIQLTKGATPRSACPALRCWAT